MIEKIKILSIDDSKAVHAFIDQSLAGGPFEALHAFTGKKGLDFLKEGLNTIRVILLDWEMPDQNGPEILIEILKITKKIPVIMLSSKNSPDDIQSVMNAGAAEYIMKPFTPDILFEKLERVIAGS